MPVQFEAPPVESPTVSLLPSLSAFSVEAVLYARSQRPTLGSNAVLPFDIRCPPRKVEHRLPHNSKTSVALSFRKKQPSRDSRLELMTCHLCGEELQSFTLQQHLQSECAARTVSCRSCGQEVLAEDLHFHETHDCQHTRKREKCFRRWKSKEGSTKECGGCGVVLTLLLLQHHRNKECPMRLVPCPSPECNAMVPLAELNHHRTVTCVAAKRRTELAKRSRAMQNQELECSECKQVIVGVKNLAFHQQQECSKRLVQCRRCGRSVQFSELAQHEMHDCPVVKKREKRLEASKIGQPQKPCQFCGLLLAPNKHAAHMRKVCDRRFVPCPEEACQASIRQCDVAEHKARDLYYGLHFVPRCSVEADRAAMAVKSRRRATQPTPCPMGCGVELPPREMAVHLRKECQHKKVRCRFCRSRVKRCELAHHLDHCSAAKEDRARQHRSELSRRQVECQFGCGQIVRYSSMKKHLRICELRLVKCELCGSMAPKAHMRTHWKNGCSVWRKREAVVNERRQVKGWAVPWKDADDRVLLEAADAIDRASAL